MPLPWTHCERLATNYNTTRNAWVTNCTDYIGQWVDAAIADDALGTIATLANMFTSDSGETYSSAVSGSVVKEIAEWQGQAVQMALEEDAAVIDGQVQWLAGRQTQLHLIG